MLQTVQLLLDESASGLNSQVVTELVAPFKEQKKRGTKSPDVFPWYLPHKISYEVSLMKQGQMVKRLTWKEFIEEEMGNFIFIILENNNLMRYEKKGNFFIGWYLLHSQCRCSTSRRQKLY